jgi:photosystem II stability/assembly factor-like uncharacterized protein
MNNQFLKTFLLLMLLLISFEGVDAQRGKKKKTAKPTVDTAVIQFPEKLYNALEWRCIGPHRGGRSAAVTGVEGKPNLYYMGATGGGLWRTKDGGQTWKNISDGYFGGSIGSVEVAASDHNVIYVGGGEVTVRGNVSYGYGVYKSVDAGKTWTHIGLPNSRHIPRMRVHPKNPDLVYAAVLGDLFKSSEERGVYRSKDGGKNWEKILFANADAGAVDLILDPNNPRILYASTWRVRRTPYSLESGGEGSALWKSTDGGDTWTNISENKGLPKGLWGISGVTVSPQNSDRIWAIIENQKDGGVYRSDDAGETWQRTNSSRALRQRAWYYSRIYADTEDEDAVYVMNVAYHKSTDGGRTFKAAYAPHGDHHDLWIAPEDNQRMVIADDGGAQVSFDGGENWSTYMNQPTAQFYRVTTDEHFPFRIYGAQQDNSTIRILNRTDGGSIGESDWEATAGGESAHIAPDPKDLDVVVAGSYGGYLTRYNHKTKDRQAINVWPDNPMGYGAEGMKYRFQWNFPVFFSPHDPNKLYTASNHMHVSYDGGQSWELISPDLTTNDSSKMVSSGGPITKDNTGVEYYCTIFAAVESPYEKDLLWVGSDDGLVHVSKDAGKNWKNVTPPNMPKWMMINSIEVDPHKKGAAYVVGTRYKLGDYQPYLYKTEDYGQSWKLIVKGIDPSHFTRTLRADPVRQGLLYAGTESGMYISFDDGANWQDFQLNLPIVPITDLAIKYNTLIAATQGRSFWMIDDLTVLHQLKDELKEKDYHLYTPMGSYRMGGYQNKKVIKKAGINRMGGVMVHYYLDSIPADSVKVTLSFHEANGNLIKAFSNKPNKEAEEGKLPEFKEGANVFSWNMYYPGAKRFDGMVLWWAGLGGPRAVPGAYKVKLSIDSSYQQEEYFKILADPRTQASQKDMQAQFDFIQAVNAKVTEAHQAIIDIRDVRKQMNAFTSRLNKEDSIYQEIFDLQTEMDSIMSKVEKRLYQTQNQSNQDPLNFPIKLTNKLAHIASLTSMGNFAPTAQAQKLKKELEAEIDLELKDFYMVRDEMLPKLNQLIREKEVDVIRIKE